MLNNLFRVITFLLGIWAIIQNETFLGIFIIVSVLFSLIFKLREKIFIKESIYAREWEFVGTGLTLANALFISFPFFPNSDFALHFWGGIFVALYAMQISSEKGKFKNWLFIFGTVALFGVLWEFAQFGMDQLKITFELSIINFQPTPRDTMFDLFADMIGGIFVLLLTFLTKNKIYEIK